MEYAVAYLGHCIFGHGVILKNDTSVEISEI